MATDSGGEAAHPVKIVLTTILTIDADNLPEALALAGPLLADINDYLTEPYELALDGPGRVAEA